MTADDYALIVAALQDALKNAKAEEHEGILTQPCILPSD